MTTKAQVVDRIAESVAGKAVYGGAGTAVFFGLNAHDFAAVSGVVIGFLGLIISAYYKQKMLEVERKKYDKDYDDNH